MLDPVARWSVDRGEGFLRLAGPKYTVTQTGDLILASTEPRDTATYRCDVTGRTEQGQLRSQSFVRHLIGKAFCRLPDKNKKKTFNSPSG